MLAKRHLKPDGNVQKYIDSQCLNLSREKVPKRENALIESGDIHTIIGSGLVRYRTPYARRWYYMPAKFNEGRGNGLQAVGRGNYWFERMKRENKEKILKGAQRIANGGGS